MRVTAFARPVRRWLKARFYAAAGALSQDIDIALQRLAAEQSAEFVEREMPMARSFKSKFDLLDAALKAARPDGLCCEFGVAGGSTINHIASLFSGEVHGFDSFEGLPEDWRSGFKKGFFARSKLPPVRSNVRLHKGWFEDTIPGFLEQFGSPLSFLHIDSDLYSSAVTILRLMDGRIVPGTVIQFDEFFNYPGWQKGEYRAWLEFCAGRPVRAEFIGYVGSDQQAALRVL